MEEKYSYREKPRIVLCFILSAIKSKKDKLFQIFQAEKCLLSQNLQYKEKIITNLSR